MVRLRGGKRTSDAADALPQHHHHHHQTSSAPSQKRPTATAALSRPPASSRGLASQRFSSPAQKPIPSSSPFPQYKTQALSPSGRQRASFFSDGIPEVPPSSDDEDEPTKQEAIDLEYHPRRILGILLLNHLHDSNMVRYVKKDNYLKGLAIFNKILENPNKDYKGISFLTVQIIQIYSVYRMTRHGEGLDILGEPLKDVPKSGEEAFEYRAEALDVGYETLQNAVWPCSSRDHMNVLVEYVTQVFIARYEMMGRVDLLDLLFEPPSLTQLAASDLSDKEGWYLQVLQKRKKDILYFLEEGDDLRAQYPYSEFFETVKEYLANVFKAISPTRLSMGGNEETPRWSSTKKPTPVTGSKRTYDAMTTSQDFAAAPRLRSAPASATKKSVSDRLKSSPYHHARSSPIRRPRFDHVVDVDVDVDEEEEEEEVPLLKKVAKDPYGPTEEDREFVETHKKSFALKRRERLQREEEQRSSRQSRGDSSETEPDASGQAIPKFRQRMTQLTATQGQSSSEPLESSQQFKDPSNDVEINIPGPEPDESDVDMEDPSSSSHPHQDDVEDVEDVTDDDDDATPSQTVRSQAQRLAHEAKLKAIEKRRYQEMQMKVMAEAGASPYVPVDFEELCRENEGKVAGARVEKRKVGRRRWTEEEVRVLEEALVRFGGPVWAVIHKAVGHLLQGRSQVDLKDKARNERLRRERNNLPLGIWGRTKA